MGKSITKNKNLEEKPMKKPKEGKDETLEENTSKNEENAYNTCAEYVTDTFQTADSYFRK